MLRACLVSLPAAPVVDPSIRGGIGGTARKAVRVLRQEGLAGIRTRLHSVGQPRLPLEAPPADPVASSDRLRVVPYYVDPRIDAAPLAPFQFGQWQGKRLTVHYGSAYDFSRHRLDEAPPLPDWLVALRERLAPLGGVLTLSPRAGGGARLEAEIPLARAEAAQ